MTEKKIKKIVDNYLESSYLKAEKRGHEKKIIEEFFYRLRDIVHDIEVDWKETDYMVANVKNLIKEFNKKMRGKNYEGINTSKRNITTNNI